MLVVLSGLAHAADPSVARQTRTALDPRKAEADRARAIVALAGVDSDEADAALVDIAEGIDPESSLGRVAVAARLQRADLEDLALNDWPTWAEPLVGARRAEILPTRCADLVIRTLPLPPAEVASACADHLPPVELADAVRGAADPADRARAASLLTELAKTSPDAVSDAVVAEFAWDSTEAWAGEEPALGALVLPEAGRLRLATELVTRRLRVVQVGGQDVPPRLDGELRAVLAPELAAFGEPTQTIDWLHLLAAGGPDPASGRARVQTTLDRLGLGNDHHYTVVLDEDDALAGDPRDLLALLAHRSPIVRARAARRLEQEPDDAIAALDRAWRFQPGRTAPLRGDVAVPALVRDHADAVEWERTLVHWARRSSRQNDDKALRATLWFATCPTTTEALGPISLQDTARALLETAKRDPSPDRQLDLLQGMDAVLRGVPFDEGARPAPDQAPVHADSWRRATEP